MDILALDVGTSSMRGILFDERGRQLFCHQIAYQVRFPAPGRAEQRAEDWRQAVTEICRLAAAFCRERGRAWGGLSLTCQRSSVIPVDREGEALTPAIMWQDSRNAEIVEALRGEEERICRRTGARLNTVFSGSKMTWLRRHQPEVYRRTYKFCTVADYLTHVITGAFKTDHTYGSRSLLMDLRRRQWDGELLSLFEVEEEKLCRLMEPGRVIGRVWEPFARATGLPVGLPLVSAGGDQQCAAVGQGLIAPGTAELTAGTGAYLLLCCDGVPRALTGQVICGAHSVPGKYVLEGSVLTCAALYNWAREQLMGGADLAAVNAAVAAAPPGANGCIALPYFQGRGTPDWNGNARGAFCNVSLVTTGADMTRALLEAVAMEVKNALDVLERQAGAVEAVRIGGGLTRFSAFNPLVADVLRRPLLRGADGGEGTAEGAWVAASAALGLFPGCGEALSALSAGKTLERYTADPARSALYEALRERMERCYRSLSWLG